MEAGHISATSATLPTGYLLNPPQDLGIETRPTIHRGRFNLSCQPVEVMQNGNIIWFWIGPHWEYEKLTTQL